MDITDEAVQASIDMLIETQRARVVCLICLTCVLWHNLSTLADEVRLVWRYGPLRLNSGLFLSIRYLTLISFAIRTWSLFESHPSSILCQSSALFMGIASLVIIAMCDLVLLIRLWAIYQRRRSILLFLLAAFTSTGALTVAFGVQWLSELSGSFMGPIPFSGSGCFLTSPTLTHHWEIYPFTIAFNSLLLVMTIYKSIYVSWNHSALGSANGYYTRMTMSSLLLRDGVMSYFVVLLALLFTAFGVFIPGWKLVALQSGIAPAVLSIATSQLQLNLRGALEMPRARFCSCPPSHSLTSPSKSSIFPLSIPSLGLGIGVTHHPTCALSSASSIIDDPLCSSAFSSSLQHDDDGECIFNTRFNDRDVPDDHYEDEEYEGDEKPGRVTIPFDCESLRLPCTPRPAHVYIKTRTSSI